jgi:hemolysin activation/secretion protein
MRLTRAKWLAQQRNLYALMVKAASRKTGAMRTIWRIAILAGVLLAGMPAAAQERPESDRSDPSIIQRELEPREPRPERVQPNVRVNTPSRAEAAPAGAQLVAGAIRVRGASRLPAAAFAPAIEPFLGRPLGQAELVELATAIANVARRAGYGLATAWVPAQEINGGVLTVQIDEGRIDAVRASGPGATFVEDRLVRLAGSGPVRTADLERELLLAGDVAGLWVGDARLVREDGRAILTVTSRYRRVESRATLDNWGGDTIGPVRGWAEVQANGVATPGDSLSVGVATTPLNPREFHLVEGRYRLPLGGRGTTVALGGYYGHTEAEPDLHTSGFAGDSWQVEVEASHPLARARARSLWLSGRLQLRNSMLERAGTRFRDDRIASMTLSLHGFHGLAGGRLRLRTSITQGLNLFDATRPGDPLASRMDAGGVFTKFDGWADYTRSFGGGLSAQAAVRAQAADGPLLSSEEMGLGGPQFLRAFDYRELSGDDGVAGSIELRFDLKNAPQVFDQIQFYAYADAGRVLNRGRDGRDGRGGSLASAGGGVRVGFARNWDLGLELGVPLTEGAFEPEPDPRFSFTLKTRF